MNKSFVILSLVLLFFLKFSPNTSAQSSEASSLQIETISIDEYFKLVNSLKTDNQVLMINFWATWCAPCVRELPLLDDFEKQNSGNIKLLLVSLDSPRSNSRVIKFLSEKNISAESYLLTVEDSELVEISKNWYGAVPLTLLYKGGKLTATYERELHKKDLSELQMHLF